MLIGTATLAAAAATFAGSAGASPIGNHSPNQEEPFPVTCDGIDYVLVDVPSSPDHADFTPAFVTTTGKLIIPFAFDARQTITVLTDGAVIDGVTYDAGDIAFDESEVQSIGARRPQDAMCTFGGSGTFTIQDDNDMAVDLQFDFTGTAKVMMPGKR